MASKEFVDQRRHKRFRVKEGMYAVLRDNGTNSLGAMLDISMGGLSYRYIPNDDSQSRAVELDIFLSGNGFKAENLPFRIVTDFEIDPEVPFSRIPLRRSGVQFGSLTAQQITQLEDVIMNDTAGED